MHIYQFDFEGLVHHSWSATNKGVIFEGAAEVWCGTEEGAVKAWQEFVHVVLMVMSGSDAKLEVWESLGDSRRMSFLSGHILSIVMCPTGFFLAWLQLKHYRA